MIPADAYAAAIVAAARLTGEDPESFGDGNPECKFRHYAFHALLSVYPDVNRIDVAAALRCPGKATYFYRASTWFVLGQGPHRHTPVEWWSDENLGTVISAVLRVSRPVAPKVVPRPVPTVPPPTPSRANPITPKPVLRLPEDGTARSGAERFSARYGRPPLNPEADPLTRRAVERGRSYDLLAEAAANTAKLQAALPPEPDAE